jgi:hypothetical protein
VSTRSPIGNGPAFHVGLGIDEVINKATSDTRSNGTSPASSRDLCYIATCMKSWRVLKLKVVA